MNYLEAGFAAWLLYVITLRRSLTNQPLLAIFMKFLANLLPNVIPYFSYFIRNTSVLNKIYSVNSTGLQCSAAVISFTKR